eukprot:354633-Chlamydomonas_euryale.AAC.20
MALGQVDRDLVSCASLTVTVKARLNLAPMHVSATFTPPLWLNSVWTAVGVTTNWSTQKRHCMRSCANPKYPSPVSQAVTLTLTLTLSAKLFFSQGQRGKLAATIYMSSVCGCCLAALKPIQHVSSGLAGNLVECPHQVELL